MPEGSSWRAQRLNPNAQHRLDAGGAWEVRRAWWGGYLAASAAMWAAKVEMKFLRPVGSLISVKRPLRAAVADDASGRVLLHRRDILEVLVPSGCHFDSDEHNRQ